MNIIEKNIESIQNICKKHKVQNLYAFGSVLDESRFNEKSDVDLIVKFYDSVEIIEYADLYFELADDLEFVLNRKVDLLTFKPIRNKYLRQSIDATKQIIYAA